MCWSFDGVWAKVVRPWALARLPLTAYPRLAARVGWAITRELVNRGSDLVRTSGVVGANKVSVG
jgi:hypothetical protein